MRLQALYTQKQILKEKEGHKEQQGRPSGIHASLSTFGVWSVFVLLLARDMDERTINI